FDLLFDGGNCFPAERVVPGDLRKIHDVAVENNSGRLELFRKLDEGPHGGRLRTRPDVGVRPNQDDAVGDRDLVAPGQMSWPDAVRLRALDRRAVLVLETGAPGVDGSHRLPELARQLGRPQLTKQPDKVFVSELELLSRPAPAPLHRDS